MLVKYMQMGGSQGIESCAAAWFLRRCETAPPLHPHKDRGGQVSFYALNSVVCGQLCNLDRISCRGC